MMNSVLDAQELEQLASDYASLATSVRTILNDDGIVVSSGQAATLSADLTNLETFASSIATDAASVAFDATAGAASTIAKATKGACAEADAMTRNARKIQAVVDVVAAAVSFGGSFASGNPLTVLGAAGKLIAANAASNATATAA